MTGEIIFNAVFGLIFGGVILFIGLTLLGLLLFYVIFLGELIIGGYKWIMKLLFVQGDENASK